MDRYGDLMVVGIATVRHYKAAEVRRAITDARAAWAMVRHRSDGTVPCFEQCSNNSSVRASSILEATQ